MNQGEALDWQAEIITVSARFMDQPLAQDSETSRWCKNGRHADIVGLDAQTTYVVRTATITGRWPSGSTRIAAETVTGMRRQLNAIKRAQFPWLDSPRTRRRWRS